MFRSQEMKYVTLTITSEAVHATLKQIGRLEKFHIVNLASLDHPTESQIESRRRMVEAAYWKRKLGNFEDMMQKNDVEIPSVSLLEAPQYQDVLAAVEDFLTPLEKEIARHEAFQAQNLREISHTMERHHVLSYCQDLNLEEETRQLEADVLHQQQQQGLERKDGQDMMTDDGSTFFRPQDLEEQHMRRGEERRFQTFLAGVVEQTNQSLLQRMVYRISRGNAFVRFSDIPQPILDVDRGGQEVLKSVFYIVCLGEQLLHRLTKLCESLNAHLYELPDTGQEFRDALHQTQVDIDEKRRVYDRTQEDIVATLIRLAGTVEDSPLRRWQEAVQTERSISAALMQCRFYDRMVIMEGWCPTESLEDLQQCLHTAAQQSNSPVAHCRVEDVTPEIMNPPTYVETNKFTSVFQAIVDTYGVPRYQEVNPGLFTVIMFPFLFGVMYGDIGHSACLVVFSLWLIWKERYLQSIYDSGKMNEIMVFAFGGRYVILLMGLFGMYCGFVYNDCFSVPLSIFRSRYWFPEPGEDEEEQTIVPGAWLGGVYPFGVDPSWYGSGNELEYFNSLKMKLSVIIGVIQMSVGIILSLYNHLFFRDYVLATLEFIPRFLFMSCVFGYMIAIIIYKWTVPWETGAPPPNLVQTMVNMFLSPGSVEEDELLYDGQAEIQTVLLLLAVLCIPFMLCGPPCLRHHLAKKKKKKTQQQNNITAQQQQQQGGGGSRAGPLLVRDVPAVNSVSSQDVIHSEAYKSLSGAEDEDRDLLAASPSPPPPHHHDAGLVMDGDDGLEGKSSAAAAVSDVPLHHPHHPHGQEKMIDDHHTPGGGDELVKEEDEDEDTPLSEMMIHNGIHTIEFILGTVSNTASYLRLWALSLAHAQLSLVFWEKLILEYGLETGNPFMVFITFGVWAGASFGVLLCMSMLECFLHALRLQWVEFQNKFFNADGYAFDPFSLEEKPETN